MDGRLILSKTSTLRAFNFHSSVNWIILPFQLYFEKLVCRQKLKLKKIIIVQKVAEIKIASGCVFPTFCAQTVTPLLCLVIELKSGFLINRPRKVLYLAIVIYWNYKGKYIYILTAKENSKGVLIVLVSLHNFETVGGDKWFARLSWESQTANERVSRECFSPQGKVWS